MGKRMRVDGSNQILNRFMSIVLTVSMVMTMVFIPLCSFADTSVQTRYKEALSREKAAKNEYDKAKAAYQLALRDFNKGSYGFYKWLYETQDGWIKEDAKDAMELMDKTAFKKYVQMGKKLDATNLDQMKYAISFLPELQELRDNDENFKGLPPVTIRSINMARAQVNADSSSVYMDHMPEDEGYNKDTGLENLAWGISDPFTLWYHMEKETYNSVRKMIIKKYGYDINIDEESDAFDENVEDSISILYCYGEIGHYFGCVTGKVTSYNFYNNTIDHYMAESSIFGLAQGVGKGDSWYCSCLSYESTIEHTDAMTIKEYTDLFNEYYDMVSAPEEKKAYEDAKKKYNNAKKKRSNAKSALKKALKVKASVSRRKNMITVKISRNANSTGYQVSVSGNKKSWKATNTKSLKKTIKSKSKKYIRTRSYVKINGKMIYGPWTKTVRR